MRLPMLRRSLFVLALVFSQWLLVAHAASHPALAVEAGCELCLQAAGFEGALPVAAAAAPPAAPLAGAPRHFAPRVALQPALRNHPIRGPPARSSFV